VCEPLDVEVREAAETEAELRVRPESELVVSMPGGERPEALRVRYLGPHLRAAAWHGAKRADAPLRLEEVALERVVVPEGEAPWRVPHLVPGTYSIRVVRRGTEGPAADVTLAEGVATSWALPPVR
jgi:hypothetical protein